MAITPAAERWLAEVGEADWPRKQALPYAISAVVAQMQALEQGRETQLPLPARTRLRTASGHWLVLHASRLAGPSTQRQIAVIMEVARPVEVASLIVQAYDLSKGEREIMQSVLHGHSTVAMAATFHISSNTVQDHLKWIPRCVIGSPSTPCRWRKPCREN